jgi:hypothetical protein
MRCDGLYPGSSQPGMIATTSVRGISLNLTYRSIGARNGTPGTRPGTSATFTGTSGTNNVIIVAKFASGTGKIMYQNVAR